MRHRLTEYEKILIIKNKDSKSYRKLASELGVAYTTVFQFYKRWLKRKAIVNKKQTGRPKGLSNRALQRLKNVLTKQPLLTLNKIKEKLNLGVHVRTLSNYARKLGFKSYKQALRPLITPR
jgi:transposase